MIFKKGQGLPLNTVIIGILVILVLVILSSVVSSFFVNSYDGAVNSCASAPGKCFDNDTHKCVSETEQGNEIKGHNKTGCEEEDYLCCIFPGKIEER